MHSSSAQIVAHLRQAAISGVPLEPGSGIGADEHAREGALWGGERTIPASLITEVLHDHGLRHRRLHIRGARIEGDLELEGCELPCALTFERCYFPRELQLRGASIPSLRLPGCHLAEGINGAELRISRDLEFLDGFESVGTVLLDGAQIGGSAYFLDSSFDGAGGEALSLDHVTVEGALVCASGFSARGEVRMLSAKIDGQLMFRDALFDNPSDDALSLDGVKVGASLICSARFVARGSVRLPRAQISGNLECGGAFRCPHRLALFAERARIDGNLVFARDHRIEGRASFDGATVAANVFVRRGRFSAPPPRSPMLSFVNATVKQEMRFLAGFQVDGQLCLVGARVAGPIGFDKGVISCSDQVAVLADRASIGGVQLGHGTTILGGLSAGGLKCAGQLNLSGAHFEKEGGIALSLAGSTIGSGLVSRHTNFEGMVRVDGAKVEGNVSFARARIHGSTGLALLMDRTSISGSAIFDELSARGLVRLDGSEIAGHLRFDGAELKNPGGIALSGDRLRVSERTSLGDGFLACGEVRMLGARFDTQLDFSNSTFESPGADALSLDNVECGSDLFLSRGFEARGSVRLPGASIGGMLDCEGGRFLNAGGIAILADAAQITLSLYLSEGFRAEGELRFLAASVGGQVICERARIENPGDDALSLDGATLEQDFGAGPDLTVEGCIRLVGVNSKSVVFRNVTLANPNDRVVAADNLQSSNTVRFIDGSVCQGQVGFAGAQITEQVIFDEVVLDGGSVPALVLFNATCRELHFSSGTRITSAVDLRGARVSRFYLDLERWADQYELEGFEYDSLGEGVVTGEALRKHLAWLQGNHAGYRPQLYDQLARALNRAGHDELQKQVLITKQRHRRGQLSWPGKAWSAAFDWFVGFGYRAWLVLVPFSVFLLFGWLFFADRRADFSARFASQNTPAFKPFTYTLDLLLPVVDLGQRDTWTAHHAAQTVSTILILTGWLLTTALLAALAAIIARPANQ